MGEYGDFVLEGTLLQLLMSLVFTSCLYLYAPLTTANYRDRGAGGARGAEAPPIISKIQFQIKITGPQ